MVICVMITHGVTCYNANILEDLVASTFYLHPDDADRKVL